MNLSRRLFQTSGTRLRFITLVLRGLIDSFRFRGFSFLFLVVPGGTRKHLGSPRKAHGRLRGDSRVPPVPPGPGSKNLKTYTLCSPLLSRPGFIPRFRTVFPVAPEGPPARPPHQKVPPEMEARQRRGGLGVGRVWGAGAPQEYEAPPLFHRGPQVYETARLS